MTESQPRPKSAAPLGRSLDAGKVRADAYVSHGLEDGGLLRHEVRGELERWARSRRWQVRVIEKVQNYMKHQGKFAVPPSAFITDFTDSRVRRGLKRVSAPQGPPRAGQ